MAKPSFETPTGAEEPFRPWVAEDEEAPLLFGKPHTFTRGSVCITGHRVGEDFYPTAPDTDPGAEQLPPAE